METICIKYQILFSGKNKKKHFKMLSVENFTQSAKSIDKAIYIRQNSFQNEEIASNNMEISSGFAKSIFRANDNHTEYLLSDR